MKQNLKLALCALVCALSIGQASAQSTANTAPAQNCPEGSYGGPREGVNRFTQDPYIWFVSPEFAKRFCMPQKFVDTTLKGALAIAVRIRANEDVSCGFLMGRSDSCYAPPIFSIDVYIDNKAVNLPKADPAVEYFGGIPFKSDRLLGAVNAELKKNAGTSKAFPIGQRRPFSPAATAEGHDKWISFDYVAVRKGGWASHNHGQFIESFYRANWVQGIDLISLDKDASYVVDAEDRYNPDKPRPHYYPEDPILGWAIAVFPKKNMHSPGGFHSENTTYYKNNVPYPQSYSHVIDIPLPLARLKHAFDQKAGQAFFDDLKRATSPR